MHILMQLFLVFCKIGAVTFGGGYAMLPILQREVVDNKKWITDEELMDYYSIGQCTPGVIAVNVATFIGNKLYGIIGGIIATIGIITPSIIIIVGISSFLRNFETNTDVIHAFVGIRVCVCVLILDTVFRLIKKSITDRRSGLIFITVLLAGLVFSVSPAILIVVSAFAGYFLMPPINKKEENKL